MHRPPFVILFVLCSRGVPRSVSDDLYAVVDGEIVLLYDWNIVDNYEPYVWQGVASSNTSSGGVLADPDRQLHLQSLRFMLLFWMRYEGTETLEQYLERLARRDNERGHNRHDVERDNHDGGRSH